MNLKEIIEFLTTNPGYLKWGNERLAEYLHIEEKLVGSARYAIKFNLKDIVDSAFAKEQAKLPKILLLDIETAPLLSYVWGLWDQNVGLDQIESDWFILCWSAKWLHQDTMMGGIINPSDVIDGNDKFIVKQLWNLLNEADIVIGHNLDKFDIKKSNTRFILSGLPPTSPYKTIDTLKIARKHFAFSSNKLEGLARKFGLEGKNKTDFNLWKACMQGDREALITMSLYCDQDVLVLEQLYYKLLPWISNHPNVNLYSPTIEETKCPNCGSKDLKHIGYTFSSISKLESFRCNKCGAISKGRNTVLNKEENKFILNAGK